MVDFWLKAVLAIIATATLGAGISKGINTGIMSWYWAVVSAMVSGLTWGWIARHKDVSLVYASVVYDVLYALTYVVFLACAGEKLTAYQVAGVGLSLLGMVVAGLH